MQGIRANSQGGCVAKVPAIALRSLLEESFGAAFPGLRPSHPMTNPEDCAVIARPMGILLASTEIAPPVVPNAHIGGRIAAFHAMNDIFASGGVPRWALVGLVVDAEAEIEEATRLLTGVLQGFAKEDVTVVGGHTTYGLESLLSITVLGTCAAKAPLSKKGAHIGDDLYISKPLGTGIIIRACEWGMLAEDVLKDTLSVMDQSNGKAAATFGNACPNAATDISGFGLLGHLCEMLGPGQGAILGVL